MQFIPVAGALDMLVPFCTHAVLLTRKRNTRLTRYRELQRNRVGMEGGHCTGGADPNHCMGFLIIGLDGKTRGTVWVRLTVTGAYGQWMY